VPFSKAELDFEGLFFETGPTAGRNLEKPPQGRGQSRPFL
jgi:hypothetical protein